MKVAFVVGGITSNASGLVPAVGGLARGLGRMGQKVSVYDVACRGREPIDFGLNGSGIEHFSATGSWLGRLSRSPALRQLLEEHMAGMDLVHNHSLWILPNHYASRIARQRHKPVFFSPQGALESWALNNSKWKKRIAGAWFQNRDITSAACFHAVNEKEVASMRGYGITQPAAVIPNGVNMEGFEALPSREALDALLPRLKNRRVVLFLARMHRKKGLSHLIPAWAKIHRKFADWHLVIAGPDDGEGQASQALVRELALGGSVTFAGKLVGDAKQAALAGSEVFVLPSFSEGFSLAILEAMACALPILLTPGCNFPEVQQSGAGIEMEPTVPDTERGLRAMLGLSDGERRTMGASARALIEQHYTWDRVAAQMLAVYQWIVSRRRGATLHANDLKPERT